MMKQHRLSAIRSALLISGLVLAACATIQAEIVEPVPFTHAHTDEVFKSAHGLAYRMHWDSLELDEREGERTTTISGTFSRRS